MLLSEITVFASDIHSVTHSPDVKTIYQCCCISKWNAMQSWCHPVLKALFKLFLASMPWMFEVESISTVNAAECGLTCSCLYLIIEDGCWYSIVYCVCIYNRVKHVRLVVIQTLCGDMDYYWLEYFETKDLQTSSRD